MGLAITPTWAWVKTTKSFQISKYSVNGRCFLKEIYNLFAVTLKTYACKEKIHIRQQLPIAYIVNSLSETKRVAQYSIYQKIHRFHALFCKMELFHPGNRKSMSEHANIPGSFLPLDFRISYSKHALRDSSFHYTKLTMEIPILIINSTHKKTSSKWEIIDIGKMTEWKYLI